MIGRKKEIDELNTLYQSQKAELVAVYGRRRVGKTYLVDQVFKGKFAFRHQTLVTTYGLQYSEYSGIFDHVITMDDLFR